MRLRLLIYSFRHDPDVYFDATPDEQIAGFESMAMLPSARRMSNSENWLINPIRVCMSREDPLRNAHSLRMTVQQSAMGLAWLAFAGCAYR